MKIVHVLTYDTGGAAKACIRIHKELLNKGIDSKVLTLYKTQKNNNDIVDFRDHLSYVQNILTKVRNKLKYGSKIRSLPSMVN